MFKTASRDPKTIDWVKRAGLTVGAAGLHWGMVQPPVELSGRVDFAFKEWTQYWGQGQAVRPVKGRILPPITAEQVENVVRRLRNDKALGPDGWEPDELRALPRRAFAQMAAIMNNS